ncbi:terpene synthase family protein [Nannocystaceae bacterium ST9]
MQEITLHYPESWRTALNRHAEQVELRTLEWARQTGLVQAASLEFDRLRFLRAGYFGGYAYPDAGRPELQAICDFLAAWLLLDDHLEFALPMLEDHERSETCSSYMEALSTGLATPDADGFERAFAEVGRRLKAMSVTPTWYRFLTSMVDYFEGVLAEISAHEVDRVVGRRRYLGFRAHAAGAYPVLDLIEAAYAYVIPLDLRDSPKMIALREHYANVICHANDIASHSKDIELGTANMVVVLQHEGLAVAAALGETARLHDEAVAEFDALAHAIEVERNHDPQVVTHLAHIRTLARGLLEWQLRASRYQTLESGRWLSVARQR